MRMREQANQNFLRQPQMMIQNGMANLRRAGVPNMNLNLQKTALQNNASGINASAMYVGPVICGLNQRRFSCPSS